MAGQVIHPVKTPISKQLVAGALAGAVLMAIKHAALPRRLQVKRFAAITLTFVVFSAVAASAADSTTLNGWISDSMCAAKHAGSGSECAKKCIEGGSAPVFVDEAKKQVWTIDNPDAVKKFYGDHVTVTATADAEKKSVHIDSIEAAK
jgi:hypothetical protein